MQIAVLGNMNNNGFSLLRYFDDLGYKTTLFLFQDDGTGVSKHFSIENDCWDYGSWKKHIRHVDFAIGYNLLGHKFPILNPLIFLIYLFLIIINKPNKLLFRPIRNGDYRKLVKNLESYDIVIGSGLSPAFCATTKKPIDIFYSYSVGVEYIGQPNFLRNLKSKNPVVRMFSSLIRDMQIEGVTQAKLCINGQDTTLTKRTFQMIGVASVEMHLPVVYMYHADGKIPLLSFQQELTDLRAAGVFIIVSPTRHYWVKPKNVSVREWRYETKNNEWLIGALESFLKDHPEAKIRLVLSAYGKDKDATKQLIMDAGISDKVIWLPELPRKELFRVLRLSDVVVGEFYSHPVFLGGVGWEVLLHGKPLINGCLFTNSEHKAFFGVPRPPLLVANSKEEIKHHIVKLYESKERLESISHKTETWCSQYYGHNLAKRLINLVKSV